MSSPIDSDPDPELEYRVAMDQLLHFGALYVAMLEALPLEKMASTVENADAVGPFVDPTTYRAALADRRLDKQRAAISAARRFIADWHAAELPTIGGPTS